MAPRELRVNTTALASEGQGLVGAAGDIPDPPQPFTATGDDPLSQALGAQQKAVEAPLIEGLPGTKKGAQGDAQSVVNAAGMYEKTDHEKAQAVSQHGFGPGGGATSPGGAGAPTGTGAGAMGTPAGAGAGATGDPSAAGAQTGGMDQMGQMMQMPMEMASQAAQLPMQMGGMLGSLPQTLMQAMQGAMQQGGHASTLTGKTDPEAGDKHAEHAQLVDDKKDDDKPDEEKPDARHGGHGAAGAQPQHGRAPTGQPQPSEDESAPAHRAPVTPRPTTSEPYSVL